MLKNKTMRFMRKLYIAACIALMFATTACKNNRDANLTEPYVYIVKDGFQVAEFYDLDHEPTAVVNIHRSGYFAADAVVNVAIDPIAIDEYNAANGTSYQVLTEGTYWLVNQTVNLTSDIRTAPIKVGFDYDTIAALPADHNYVVPLRISSESNINESKSVVLVSPTMLPAEIFFMPNREETVKWTSDSAYVYERKLTVSVPFNNPMDCTITLDTSIAAFNKFGNGSTSFYCRYITLEENSVGLTLEGRGSSSYYLQNYVMHLGDKEYVTFGVYYDAYNHVFAELIDNDIVKKIYHFAISQWGNQFDKNI